MSLFQLAYGKLYFRGESGSDDGKGKGCILWGSWRPEFEAIASIGEGTSPVSICVLLGSIKEEGGVAKTKVVDGD